MTELLTREQVEQALPPNLRGAATQTFTDQINTIVADPVVAEQVRNNFISYSAVMKDGKFKTEDYLNAVVYVSYKLMNMSNHDAYAKTFPTRYRDLVAKGTASKDIAAYVSAYNKGKLVNLVLEQCLVPTWVLNQDMFQKAINVQYELMTDEDVSPKVRSDAANSLLTHLKKPETAKVELDLGFKENSGLKQLSDTLHALAGQQADMIKNGASVREIAGSKLIESTATEVDDDTDTR